MANIKEWQKFFVGQFKFIFQEFEGLEQVYGIAKNIEKWGDKRGVKFIEEIARGE